MVTLVFLGPPASGKGTQGRRVAEDLSLSYLSTGGLLRAALKENSAVAEQIRPYLDQGLFVPDEIMLPLVTDWLNRQSEGWVLDGFPRTLAQAEALDAGLTEAGRENLRAIHLEVDLPELRQRVGGRVECESCHWVSSTESRVDQCTKCGGRMVVREDDDVVRFERRYREYAELVIPAVHYYEDSTRLHRVDAVGDPEEIYGRIMAQIKQTELA